MKNVLYTEDTEQLKKLLSELAAQIYFCKNICELDNLDVALKRAFDKSLKAYDIVLGNDYTKEETDCYFVYDAFGVVSKPIGEL